MVDIKIAEHLLERGEDSRGMGNGTDFPVWKRKYTAWENIEAFHY